MKYIIGFIAGVLLTFSMSVYAEEIESYIGCTIEGQFPILVDGTKLDKPVLVIDGTSYLPVRAAGELFGYDVSFIDSQVILKKEPEVKTMAQTETPEYTLDQVNRAIESAQGMIPVYKRQIKVREDLGDPEEKIKVYRDRLTETQERLEYWQNIKAQLESAQ